MKRTILFLAALIAAQAPALAAPSECGCEDFDKLQQELENAVKLRDRHQAKAEEMERREKAGEAASTLKRDYSNWEKDTKNGAGAGIVATTTSTQEAIGYIPRGNQLMGTEINDWTSTDRNRAYPIEVYDAEKAKAIEKRYADQGKDLCGFDEDAVRKSAEESSPCGGVAAILVNHEKSHRNTCNKMGFIAFYDRSAAALARDEVTAYNAQIAALQQEIAKSLKGAQMQFEDETHMNWSAQMISARFRFTTAPAKGNIPDNDGHRWEVKLKGVQRAEPLGTVIMGKTCKQTGYSRDVELTVAATGKETRVTFDRVGKTPPTRIDCGGPMHGGSFGSGPESASGGFTTTLKSQATHEEDIAKGPIAAMAKPAGITVTGNYKAKLSLICPVKPK